MQKIHRLLGKLELSTFDELIKWLGSGEHHAQSAIWERLNCRLLSEAIMDGFLPGRSAILQIVLAVPDGKMLKRVLSDEVRHDPFKKYLFEEMLVNKVFSPEQNVPIKLVQCINVFIEEHTSTE
ncbi:unnamed protein product, partial [Anisakis simplex]|uniref:DUF2294 domain-containing protein n=1 Tax=Anisakis simplex TaxID=6269 RepID=A0A0M3JH11_ANISI